MSMGGLKALVGIAGALALGGCVTEAPVVGPGQGKTFAQFQRDDALCRGGPARPASGQTQTTAPTAAAPVADGDTYYRCMAARGEMVGGPRPVGYPVYAGYPYAAYPYPYPYPYGYGYPYPYGYGYPAAYIGPYVGVGIGFGFGRGYYGGYDHDGFRGGRDGFRGSGTIRR